MQQTPDPAQEKRVLAAVALSVLVLWVFQSFVFELPPVPLPVEPDEPVAEAETAPSTPSPAPTEQSSAVAVSDDDDPASSPSLTKARAVAAPIAPELLAHRWGKLDELGVDREVLSQWSNYGGTPTSIKVAAYQSSYELDWLPTWLLAGFKNGLEWGEFDMGWPNLPDTGPVDIVRSGESEVLLPVGVDSNGIADDIGYYRVTDTPDSLSFTTRRGDLGVTKLFELPKDGYELGYTVTFQNLGSQPVELVPSIGVADRMVPTGDRFGSQSAVWGQVAGDVQDILPDKLDKKSTTYEGAVDWLGVGDRYFLIALEPTEPLSGKVVMEKAPGAERYAAVYVGEQLTLQPGERYEKEFRLFMGPKELDLFSATELKMASSVNFGMFGIVALPILAFLKFIYSLVGNWGISIILLTICIKGALFPLSQKSYRSMKGMQKLQPEIEKLKEKLGDDKEALNKEMMGLWKEHGVNPLGGCLPMFLQMPIWFALYRVLWNSVELYQTPFLYFADLSLRDPLGVFPLVLGVTMWLQQKMTPSASADPTQQKIMRFMPLFFSVIMFTLPAGLVVYILVNNILSIGQQWLIHRSNDDPPGAKADEASASDKGKKRKKKARASS